MQPYEIIASPLTIYVGPVATAFPDIDAVPGVGWFKLGTSGDKSYEDEGVTVNHTQTFGTFRGAGATKKRKAWRQEEDLSFGFTLVDLSASQYAKVLNDAALTTVVADVGTPGTISFELDQGIEVVEFALLARGLSTVDEDLAAQYQVPRCYQAGSPAPVWGKGGAAGLACLFEALEGATANKLVIQTAAEEEASA